MSVHLFTPHKPTLCVLHLCVCVSPPCSPSLPLWFHCECVFRTTSSWGTTTLTFSVTTATWPSCLGTLPSQPTGRLVAEGVPTQGPAGVQMAKGAAAPQRRRWSASWTPVSRSCWAAARAWFSPSRIMPDPPLLLPASVTPPWPDPSQTASPSSSLFILGAERSAFQRWHSVVEKRGGFRATPRSLPGQEQSWRSISSSLQSWSIFSRRHVSSNASGD